MKIWLEKSYTYSEDIKLGLNWFKWSPDFSFKGATFQLVLLHHLFLLHYVNDASKYHLHRKKQEERRQKYRDKLERLRNKNETQG